MSDADLVHELKRQSAVAAADLIEDGMVVGLGTGSTAALFVEELGQRVRDGLQIVGIPTSKATEAQALSLGISLVSFETHPVIDLTVDGADEVERGTLNLIKGLGGALLREKIVAASSRRMVVVADDRKIVDHLGEHVLLPVEVVPFGWESTAHRLGQMGARVEPRHGRDGKLFITDGGNLTLDCSFGVVTDPAALEERLKLITGVVDSGLFINRADEAIIAGRDGVIRLTKS